LSRAVSTCSRPLRWQGAWRVCYAERFVEFSHHPPEWHVDRREYMMAEPLRGGADGHIVLSDSPGMGYDPATDRLASTRIV
jgi:hypothetical protein